MVGALVNDWTVTGVLTLQSGVPDRRDAGHQQQRVRRLRHAAAQPGRRSRAAADERSVSRWFNTGAFTPAPQFTLGSGSRNPVRGPGYRNLDLALIRRVPLPGSNALEFAPRSST